MNLLPFRHLWGVAEPFTDAIDRFAALGYAGIECVAAVHSPALRDRIQGHGMKQIILHITAGKTAAEHVQSLREGIAQAKAFSPILINVHGGADGFSLNESLAFFREAMRIEAGEGVPLAFETHRGRILYNPWRTAEMVDAFPTLKLCADYSHWCVVCERILGEEERSILEKCASRVLHVHTRVGYAEGPQVPDPRVAEYRPALEAHESWWRMIWANQKGRGVTVSTFTPEFGPPAYLHTDPATGRPLADLAEVCEWMTKRVQSTFGDWSTNG